MNISGICVYLFFTTITTFATSIEFNRVTTGVEYSAYVKQSENGSIPGWNTYSMEDMKTMMKVMSSKFSRVATYGVGADNVPYVRNQTYYKSNAQVMTAESAALINQERQNLSLTVFVGIWMAKLPRQMKTEVYVALESAEIANEIYPGTVEGLVFSQDIGGDSDWAKLALDWIRAIRNISSSLGLKLGTRQKCYQLNSDPPEDPDSQSGKLLLKRQSIVAESDFIICEAEPAIHNVQSGAKNGFITVGNDLLGFREDLRKINPNIDVMGKTMWASKGDKPWENIRNLRDYWIEADKWASKNQFHIWLLEAFDCPWKNWAPREAYFGWWRLTSNNASDRVDGYIEKIHEKVPLKNESQQPPPPPTPTPGSGYNFDQPTGTSPWVYVGVAVGLIVAIFIVLLVFMLFLRVNKLQAALTKDDIREFMYGVSDEAVQQQGGETVVESALRFPYDKSYELSKEKLKIKRDQVLGSGQFGCVYMALIEDEEKTEVALKMAKHDCPKSALKGILSEIKILTYLGKHANIVSIIGAYTTELGQGVVYVATELCTLGSLESYLRNIQTGVNQDRYANAPVPMGDDNYINDIKREISFSEMVRWSHEIACGMEYLGTKHVVHADLATRNVLLSADRTAKITDFGLSRRLYDYTNYVKQQQEPLPWRWMSVESLKRLEFSSKSDVWAYGITLWEIFSMGDLPYPGLSWNLDFVDSLVNGLRMKSPPYATSEVYGIMLDCWYLDPKDRPTFTDLKLSTSEILCKPT